MFDLVVTIPSQMVATPGQSTLDPDVKNRHHRKVYNDT